MLGFRQHNPHHAFDVYTHTAYVVAGVPPELPLRWAALLHDVAKPACFTLDEEGVGHFRGHAHRGAEMAREILGQLHAPRALQDRVATLIAYHGVTRDPAAFDRFEASLRQILAEQPCLTTRDLAISGRDLLELGLPQGPELGRILRTLLEEVGDGRLPNTPEVLLRRAEVLHQRHNANRRKS